MASELFRTGLSSHILSASSNDLGARGRRKGWPPHVRKSGRQVQACKVILLLSLNLPPTQRLFLSLFVAGLLR